MKRLLTSLLVAAALVAGGCSGSHPIAPPLAANVGGTSGSGVGTSSSARSTRDTAVAPATVVCTATNVGALPGTNVGALPGTNVGALPGTNVGALPGATASPSAAPTPCSPASAQVCPATNVGALPGTNVGALPGTNVGALPGCATPSPAPIGIAPQQLASEGPPGNDVCRNEKTGNPHQSLCHVAYSMMQPPVGYTTDATQVPGYHPSDLAMAYNYNLGSGSGGLVAIVVAFHNPNLEADLAAYRSTFGLPPCTVASGCLTFYDGDQGASYAGSSFDGAWALEAILDASMVSAACPNCGIAVVEAKQGATDHFSSAVQFAIGLNPIAISNSYYTPEASDLVSNAAAYSASNIAITASSGDSGYGANFPAVIPNVIAVGGTTLTRDGSKRGFTETVWSRTGSGCSAVFPKPAYQTDAGCAQRTANDISVVANPNTGVAVYNSATDGVIPTGWLVLGGTSVGAPLVAGMVGSLGHHVTNPAETLYRLRSNNFNTVASGSNGTCPMAVAYLCTALGGYSAPDGLGTPNMKWLARGLR